MDVTIKDIAEVAGVSVATVSRVLNNKDNVRKETKDKVMDIAKELNYQADFNARSLKTNKTHTLGLIIPDLTNPFYAQTSSIIENVVHDLGYSTIICNTNNQPKLQDEYINILRQRRVDGIIFGSARIDDKSITDLKTKNVPYITYHRCLKKGDTNYITTDDVKGIKQAVDYLVSCGHKKIAFLSGPRIYSTSIERLRGFLQARKEYNLDFDPDLIRDGEFVEEKAWEETQNLINLTDPPTAIIAANDIMALGALDCCIKSGLSVPQDISIIGYDDIYISSHARIQLTTVSVHPEKIARKTAELFVKKVLTKENSESVQLRLDPKLIIRNTTA